MTDSSISHSQRGQAFPWDNGPKPEPARVRTPSEQAFADAFDKAYDDYMWRYKSESWEWGVLLSFTLIPFVMCFVYWLLNR